MEEVLVYKDLYILLLIKILALIKECKYWMIIMILTVFLIQIMTKELILHAIKKVNKSILLNKSYYNDNWKSKTPHKHTQKSQEKSSKKSIK